MTTWQQIRQQVLERDTYRCQYCGNVNRLDIHHVVARNKGGLDILENLITLCRKCHKAEEFKNHVRMTRTVYISKTTRDVLSKLGSIGQTFNDVIWMLIKEHKEKEKPSKK